MKLPLKLDGHTVWDADGRVIISAFNPCDDGERQQICDAVNATAKERGRRKSTAEKTATFSNRNCDRFDTLTEAREWWEKHEQFAYRQRMAPYCNSCPSVAMEDGAFEAWLFEKQ